MSKQKFRSKCLEISGKYACFTNPVMKAERVSYDFITPSAAKGIFKSIYWKPEMDYNVNKIEILSEYPPKRQCVMTKEFGFIPKGPINYEDLNPKDRQLRSNTFLKNVKYRIHANIMADSHEHFRKCEEIFERRMRGENHLFRFPHLGLSEFTCEYVKLILDENDLNNPPIHEYLKNKTIEQHETGFMLYDIIYNTQNVAVKTQYYKPRIINGVIDVPNSNDIKEVITV